MMTAAVSPARLFKATRYTVDGVRTQYFSTAGQRDHVAHQLADSTGSVVYTWRWQPTSQSLLLDQGWVPEATIVPGLDEAGYLTISLTVLNMYEHYADVTTTFTDVRIPAPPDPDDQDAYESWRYEHIHDPFTGVGHVDGDSWYVVTVTACSDPDLVGREFEFGF